MTCRARPVPTLYCGSSRFSATALGAADPGSNGAQRQRPWPCSSVSQPSSSKIAVGSACPMSWQRCGEAVEAARAVARPRSSCSCVGMCSREDFPGPLLTDGRQADAKSPFKEQEVPAGGLYLGDQGFFEQGRLRQWHQRQGGQRRYYRRWGLGSTREAGIASCCRNRREPAWNWACWSAARRGCPHA